MSEQFDVPALIRASALSIAAGMIVGAITYFALTSRDQWTRWRTAVALGIGGLILMGTVFTYYAWPSLAVVPSLDRLSQAEAETLLVRKGLVPKGRPQYALNISPGRVIPHSQSPGYGLSVRPGTMVTFAVSVRQESGVFVPPAGNVNVAVFRPKSGEKASCQQSADGVVRCDVSGTASGVSDNGRGLLLWVRPVKPPSDVVGWYLQRPPVNGVVSVAPDGTWNGLAQIGNAQWPPREGDIFDVAVSIADRRVLNDLVAEPGVVVRGAPVGLKTDLASGVVVTLR